MKKYSHVSTTSSKLQSKLLYFVVAACFLMLLCGCGKTPPDRSQIEKDLVSHGLNCFTISAVDESFDIKKVQIEKRLTDENIDQVFINVELKNNSYKASASYALGYVLYTEGGWILEYYELSDFSCTPLKSDLNVETITSTVSEEFEDVEIVSQERGQYIDNIYTDTLIYTGSRYSNYLREDYIITYTYQFKNKHWTASWNIEPSNTDWKNLIGTWEFKHYDEYVTLNITDIHQTDNNNVSVTYSYATSPWYDAGPYDGYFNSETDGSAREVTQRTETFALDRTTDEFKGKYGLRYPCIAPNYAFIIPIDVGNWHNNNWNNKFYIYITTEKGPSIPEFKYKYKNPEITTSYGWLSNTTTVYFKKQIDWDAVQDAINKGKGQ